MAKDHMRAAGSLKCEHQAPVKGHFMKRVKNIVFTISIYIFILLSIFVLIGVMSQYMPSREAGRIGWTFAVISVSSCFLARKFENCRLRIFLKLFLITLIFYLAWNLAAHAVMALLLNGIIPHAFIFPSLAVSWLAKLVTWLLPYLLYRILKNRENISKLE